MKMTILSCTLFLSTIAGALAQSAAFTYQGRVMDKGTNFSGIGQFKFALVTSTNFNRQATATAVDNSGFITSYNVTYGGSGYVSVPAVTISGGGGGGAAATANISGGSVVSISVNNPGTNYVTTPTVSIAPPPANVSYVTFWSNDGTSSAGSEPAGAVSVSVSNGLFTVTLGDASLANMTVINGSLFAQPSLQLRIWFSDGVNGFAALDPAQNLTPAPYAIFAASASNLSGTLPVAQLSGTIPANQLPGAVVTNNATSLNLNGAFSGSYSGNGSGLTNVSGTFPWQVVSGTAQQAQPNTGYVLTNNSLVTLTLPASPNVGDVVRVTGGAGGWKISQNPSQFIASVNLPGNLGLVWTPRDTSRNWGAVASSADGTKLAATVIGGQIYVSGDSGVTWTPRAVSTNWASIASSSDGTKLVAVIQGADIYTSTDSGVTWLVQNNGANRNWQTVASSADGTKLVAAVLNGQIYTSIDSGALWTPRNLARYWTSVASSADGSNLVATVTGGQIYTSPDAGVTWFARDSSRSWQSVASSADGANLVAAAYGDHLYTSPDAGVTWTPRAFITNWVAVASSSDGSKLVALVSGGGIYTSADSGVTWTESVNAPQSATWASAASSADGSKLVALDGQIYTSAPSSASNTTIGTAGYLFGDPYSAVELQYFGNSQFVPISHEGTMGAY